jgi:recombination protein RecA
MPSKKKTSVNDDNGIINTSSNLRAFLTKQYGDVFKVDGPPALNKVLTGLVNLDILLGGGFPKGRIIEIWGAPSVGKTTFTLHLAELLRRKHEIYTVYNDLERTVDKERLNQLGVNIDNFLYLRPYYGDEALKISRDSADNGAGLIVIDSVPCLRPSPKPGQAEKEPGDIEMAPEARLLAQSLPHVVPVIERNDAILIFINQMRSSIGGYGGSGPCGGNALKFYKSISLKLSKLKASEEGVEIEVLTSKNKCSPPGQKCVLFLNYKTGFDPIYSLGAELQKQGLLVVGGGGWRKWTSEGLTKYGLTEERIGQGDKALTNFFNNNLELYDHIYNDLLQTDPIIDPTSLGDVED